MIKLKILAWGGYLGLLGWPSVFIRVLSRGMQEGQRQGTECVDGTEVGASGASGRGTRAAPEAAKGQERILTPAASPAQSPQRSRPCHRFDFSCRNEFRTSVLQHRESINTACSKPCICAHLLQRPQVWGGAGKALSLKPAPTPAPNPAQTRSCLASSSCMGSSRPPLFASVSLWKMGYNSFLVMIVGVPWAQYGL